MWRHDPLFTEEQGDKMTSPKLDETEIFPEFRAVVGSFKANTHQFALTKMLLTSKAADRHH
jgi:hypothetical protein